MVGSGKWLFEWRQSNQWTKLENIIEFPFDGFRAGQAERDKLEGFAVQIVTRKFLTALIFVIGQNETKP